MQCYISTFAIGKGETLPSYVANNKGLVALDRHAKGRIFRDNLCFFRCLAYAKMDKNYESEVMSLYSKYTQQPVKEFLGVTLEDITKLETLFEVCINVYALKKRKCASRASSEITRAMFWQKMASNCT